MSGNIIGNIIGKDNNTGMNTGMNTGANTGANTGVLIAGVGGQGTVLASKILSLVAMKAGLEVKQSEIHGMSQRGGSVVTHVRLGARVYSPLVTLGGADAVIAFEELEALRYLPYLRSGGLMIVNRQRLLPMPVITGAAQYPAAPVDEIRAMGARVTAVDAAALARDLGDARAANVVLLGILARTLPFAGALWREAIGESLKHQLAALNLRAFEAGQAV
ncbi:MAG: indolepyruvate oxidoreductase subunit beta [Peptococcaceae bacterium]|jgi:indolepyruvate ferredoxin oxidoreductase beta subunit|nr:indolepyruvate oxidoreductase subunit beta [Peptococcaceae bacterium]